MGETLTLKQERFAKHYLDTGNATKAAKDAGYAESGAHVEGSRLLKNPKVQAYMEELTQETPSDKDITAEVVTRRLWRESVNAKEGGTRVKALELLGKRLGMFRDVVDERPQPAMKSIQESYKKLVDAIGEEGAKKYLLSEGIDIDKLVSIEKE